MEEGTLSLGANDLNATTLTVDGTLSGTGTVTVGGLLTLNGTVTGAGTVDADGGITINPSDSSNDATILDGTTLNNAAGQTATWVDLPVELDDGAVFNNLGTFSIPAPSVAGGFDGYWYQRKGAPSSFINSGAFIDSSGGPGGNCYFAVPFDSLEGTVDVKSGAFSLLGGGTSTGGTFTAESGDELSFGGDNSGVTWTFDASSSIDGAGTVEFGGDGTINMNGTYDVTGTTSSVGGSAIVNFNGPVDSIGPSLIVDEDTVNFDGAFVGTAGTIDDVEIEQRGTINLGANDLNPTTMNLGTGTLAGTGTITVSGLLESASATISGSCIVDADGGTAAPADEPNSFGMVLDGCTFNNPAGQTITGASGDIYIPFSFENGAVFNNYGTLDATSQFMLEQNFTGSGTESSFNNEGTLVVDFPLNATPNNPMGTPIEFQNVAFNDDGGSVDVKKGGLLLWGGGTSTGGSFTIESGNSLEIGNLVLPDFPYTFDAATTLSGAGSLIISNPDNPVTFAGTSTLTGSTSIINGTLQFDGSQPSSADTDGVQNDLAPTLSGTGTVGPITATTATISPGDGTTEPGILTADGDVALDSASTFSVALNGATAGTDYDQLDATGSVSLGGSTLDGTLGFTPAAGETFTIIKSTAPITGTFAGSPEGSSLTIGGVPFTISYAAEGGDEVVLTSAGATTTSTTTTLSSSANPSTVGQSVTFTAAVAAASGAGTPTGTVTFTFDGQAETPVDLAVVGGADQAAFSTSTLAIGTHTISAAYSGDSSFTSSTVSTPLTQTVTLRRPRP